MGGGCAIFEVAAGSSYSLVVTLAILGGVLMCLALLINKRVARAADAGDRTRERLYEYYRNTSSQVGVILLGIGVSLFVFLVQQTYQDRYRAANEVRQLVAKIAVRVGRAAAVTAWLADIDRLIHYDEQGEYLIESGLALAEQIDALLAMRNDIDAGVFAALRISEDIAASPLAGELDPVLSFAITEDETEAAYGVAQIALDFARIDAILAGQAPLAAVLDPAKASALAKEAKTLLFHMDILRDRGRRLIGRGCWFLATGPDFLELASIPELEANYPMHEAWMKVAKVHLSDYNIGHQSCYDLMRFEERTSLQD